MNFLSFFFKRSKVQPDLECLPDAMLLIAGTGEIIESNAKSQDLFATANFDNYDLLDLFDGGYNLVCDLVKTGASSIVRSKLKPDDDRYFEIKASNYDDETGEMIVSVRDVTSTQKMLNKLIFEHEFLNKITKEKNLYISKISGELTSPLHSVNGFSKAVLEGLSGEINEKQEKYLKIINKNSEQLLDLITKIVEYSKLESGMYDYEFKVFDFVTLISDIFNDYKIKADEKKLALNIDLNNLTKRGCYSDENIVKKIIEYLIDTAIKASETGVIKVEVSTPSLEFLEIAGFNIPEGANDKTFLMFKITDASAGLSENEKDLIFNPYAEVEKSITKKTLNRNLTMGLVYLFVKLIKGKIWIESDQIKGTSYTFVIPSEKIGAKF